MERTSLIKMFSSRFPGGGSFHLEMADRSTIRLRFSHAPAPVDYPSYARMERCWPEEHFAFYVDDDGNARLETSSLMVEITETPFSIRVSDSAGNVRFETSGNPVTFQERAITLRRKVRESEAIYGLGEHGEVFNRLPGRYRIWNKDEPHHHPMKQFYCTIPFGISHGTGTDLPHGFFVDNPGEVIIDAGMANHEEVSIEAKTGDLDLWLFFEDSPARILEEYTALTGRMQRPPMWALGYQQCRWSYPTEERIREVTSEFRKRRIPCDVIYFDIDYMDRYAVFTWNKETFPDPGELTRSLGADGFSVVTIVDPGVAIRDDYDASTIGAKTPHFFLRRPDGSLIVETVWPGEVNFPDFTHENTRTIWGEWQAVHLLDLGVSGIWNDMNEPAVFGSHSKSNEMFDEAIHYDHGHFRTHREVHNIYGLTMARTSCEGQLSHRPELRPFTLTRSGWAGIQRWSAVWTGDNRAAFATMPFDVQLNLSLGLSGVSFVGCDIGGFFNDATPQLFARWIEWGVFQPFCRGHSAMGTIDQEPWVFGPEVEKVARRMIELRYQLLPYIYTAFVEAAESGAPVNRPLVFEYPQDATVLGIGDEFLLGKDILVAPVMDPGKDHRALYLPPGEWMHLWTEERHQGGRWVVEESRPGRPPVYLRAGSIIPVHPSRQHTKEPEPEITFLDVVPSVRMSGKLVEDDGSTTEWQDGAETMILFSGEESSKGLKLLIGAPQGSWKSSRKFWGIRLHRADRKVSAVYCNQEKVEFEQQRNMTTWQIPDIRKAMEIKVEYE